MTKPDYTAICLVIDSSGSMETIRTDTDGMINGFIRDQAEQAEAGGKRTIRIWTFSSNTYRDTPQWLVSHCSSTPAAEIEEFHLKPSGGTALLDAMGETMTAFGVELAELPEDERPANVIYAVMTDGHENSSQEYTWEQISTMSERQQEKYSWDVVYLGANQDAIKVGSRLGVKRGSSMSYAASSAGVTATENSLRSYVASSASGVGAAFTDEDRARAMGKDAGDGK